MNSQLVTVWIFLLGILLAAASWMVFGYAPIEKSMGIIQKIFYIHVPSAFVMFGAFGLSGIAGLVYLIKRTPRADALSLAAAEVGLLFSTIVLITGPLWAKPIWGSWWTWEPRLTSTLILWLIFVAYFLIRQSTPSQDQGRVFAAAIAIFGCLDIPIIMVAVRLWRGLHPSILGTDGGLPPSMMKTFGVSTAAILMLATTLVGWRYANETKQR